MKLKLFLFFFLILNFANAQNLKWAMTSNLGISKIQRKSNIYTKSKFIYSGNVGFLLEGKLGKTNIFRIELLWAQLEGLKRKPSEGPFSSAEEERIHTSYIGIPFSLGYHYGRVNLRFGLQPMIFIFANSHYYELLVVGSTPFSYERKRALSLKRYNLGPKIGLDIIITNHFQLRADYFTGLFKLDPTDDLYGKSLTQITMGIVSFF